MKFSVWQLAGAFLLGFMLRAEPLPALPGLPAWVWPIGQTSPISDPGFRVLIVEETDSRSSLSTGQIDAILSTKAGSARAYVESKGGTLRPIDKDDSPEMLEQPWKKLFARPYKSLPWLEVANPPRGFEGPLPQTESETLAILKKVGG